MNIRICSTEEWETERKLMFRVSLLLTVGICTFWFLATGFRLFVPLEGAISVLIAAIMTAFRPDRTLRIVGMIATAGGIGATVLSLILMSRHSLIFSTKTEDPLIFWSLLTILGSGLLIATFWSKRFSSIIVRRDDGGEYRPLAKLLSFKKEKLATNRGIR